MVEVPQNTQFVGQADVKNFRMTETAKPAEFTLSPEQQRIGDALDYSGKELEDAILDAREQAGNKLQKLQGKALVDAGFRQMGRGMWESVKGAAIGTVIGAGAGALLGKFDKGMLAISAPVYGINSDSKISKHFSPSSQVGAIAGGAFGASLGSTELSALSYNKKAKKDISMLPTRWYDWAVSRVISTLVALPNVRSVEEARLTRNFDRLFDAKKNWTVAGIQLGADILLNPTTISGLRSVINGMFGGSLEVKRAAT